MKIVLMVTASILFAASTFASPNSRDYMYDSFAVNSDGSKTFSNPRFKFDEVEYPLTSYSRNIGCVTEDLRAGISGFCKAIGEGRAVHVTSREPTNDDPTHEWAGIDFITGVLLNSAGQFKRFCSSEAFVKKVTCRH